MRSPGIFAVALAALVGFAVPRAAARADDGAPRVEEVAPGVFAVLQPPARRFNESNSLFVVGEAGVLAVDTQSSLAATRQVIDEIRARTELPVTRLLLTHWHGDHVQGVAAYRELWPDVEVVGHRSLAEEIRGRAEPQLDADVKRWEEAIAAARERLRQRVDREGESLSAEGQATLAEQIADAEAKVAAMKAIPRPVAVPDLGYAEELILGSGADAARVRHWRAHTRADSTLYLPAAGVLVTGDVLDDLPFGGHGYPQSWVAALEELAELEIRVVVPGHGSLRRGSEHLELVLGLFRAILRQVAAAVDEGLDLEATQERVDLDAYRRQLAGEDPVAGRAWDSFVPATIERAWLEARGELPDLAADLARAKKDR